MNRENTIDVLNILVTINNDRIEGYETASKETDDLDLMALFTQLSATSQHCNSELKAEVRKLGGEPAEGTLVTGKFFRAWMDVKAALTGKDRKAILSSCEFGEDVAKDAYADVLKNDAENLTDEMKSMISAQQTLLLADHDKVKALRDSVTD